jgi:hypothetical protein
MTINAELQTDHEPNGATPVGFLTELTALEATSISLLRAWCNSEETQFEVITNLILNLGSEKGNQVAEYLRNICKILFLHSRRTFMRHNMDCQCIGADEAYFATIILSATNNNIEEAKSISSFILKPSLLSDFVITAKELGSTIKILNKTRANYDQSNVNICTLIH